jgi:hypothetical protein
VATGRIGVTPNLGIRWSKVPTGGTTSLSGNDDNSVPLAYSAGYEAVYRNGVLLSRGNDYTATNGTSITLVDATITGDLIEVFANQTVALTDTYSQSAANAKFINNTLTTTTGDIIYASAANTPARLGIGSTNQVLTVSGGVPSWATPSSGALALVKRASFSSVATTTTTFDDVFTSTYKNYQIVIEDIESSTNNAWLYFQYRYAGPTTQAASYYGSVTNYDHNGTTLNTAMAGVNQISLMKIGNSGVGTNGQVGNYFVSKVGASGKPAITGQGAGNATTGAFNLGCTQDTQRTYTGFILSASAGNLTGTVSVYGLATA